MDEGSANQRLDFGKMAFGCKHYRRRCKIRAPCCNEVFDCRHCHKETTSMLSNPFDRHELVRHDVEQVICSVCDTEQAVARVCGNCGVNMGEYFCEICKFYDDTDKRQFHCDDCGICRIGGRENFFHCEKCGTLATGCCYSVLMRDNHTCVENTMRRPCPTCCEYLFDSTKVVIAMKCGHTMHSKCYSEMIKFDKYCCPICSKPVIDMSKHGRKSMRRLKQPSHLRITSTRMCLLFIQACKFLVCSYARLERHVWEKYSCLCSFLVFLVLEPCLAWVYFEG